MAQKTRQSKARKTRRRSGIPTNMEIFENTPPWDWPRNAGTLFLDIFTDRNALEKDRVTAAGLAGDFTVVDDKLCNALIDIVGDAGEPERLRAAAAISFGAVLEQADLFGFEDPGDVPITEQTFDRIQRTLHALYLDESVPVLVRRRALEASVRAPQDWHPEAVTRAYSTGNRDWMLTAVFSMRWIRGFDDLIVQALQSTDPEIHLEAVNAAGHQEVQTALGHINTLIEGAATPKPLLLAAIDAVVGIAPADTARILSELADSDDEEIAEAAEEAIASAMDRESFEFDEEDPAGDEEDDKTEWVN